MTLGLTNSGGPLNEFDGTVTGNTITGQYFTEGKQTGTFVATKQGAAKFAAVEKMGQYFFKDKATNVVTSGLQGVFKIVATVPIPQGFDFSSLNEETVFRLDFAGFNGQSIMLGYDPQYIAGVSTKVRVQQGQVYKFGKSTFIPLTFELDWSTGKTLKISIAGNYGQVTFPDVGSPYGFSIQALNYVDSSTGKSTLTGQDVSVTFGTLKTTMSVVSAVGVKTKPFTANGKTYQVATIGIISTTLKSSKTPAGRARAAKP